MPIPHLPKFILAGAIVPALSAQVSIHGSLSGRITDPSDAAVNTAVVSLIEIETNFEMKAASGTDGHYSFARVSPGRYRASVEKEGFRRVISANFSVGVNEAVTLNIPLVLGDRSDVVNIESAVQLIQTQSVDISGVVKERNLKELPLNGRNFQKLVLTAPGVAGQGGSTPNNPSISGARPVNNTYTIDGLGSNDERLAVGFVGLSNGSNTDLGDSVPNMISTESIQEFRIVSSNADATFGRASGGQINIVTKSGSNDYHGSAYWYLRNDRLDARDFFNYGPFLDDSGNARTPPYKQNLFGGTLGGHIVRNKHFFFTNYEGLIQRRQEQSAVTTAVPNADLIGLVPGDLGRYLQTYYVDRGIVPAQGNPAGLFSPLTAADRAAAIAAGFPARLFDGNQANGEAGTVQISNAPPRNIDQNGFLVRTDHQLTQRLRATVRYSLTQSDVIAGTSALALNLQEGERRYQQATAQLVYTINPSQIIEGRAGFLRNRFEQFAVGGQIDPRLTALGISSEYGMGVSAGTLFSANINSAFIDNQTTPQVSIMHSWVKGKWTLRSGADLRWIMLNVANISSGTPSYTFASTAVGTNGILGPAPGVSQAVSVGARLSAYGVVTGPTTPMRGYRSPQQEYFVQGDWRLLPNVTLNLGLRYSLFGVYSEVNQAISNLYAINSSGAFVGNGSPFQFGRTANNIAPVGAGLDFYRRNTVNFQPRLGISWDITGNGRTIFRAGYGHYYDRVTQLSFTNVVTNVPFAVSSNTADVPFILGASVPITAAANPAIALVNPELKNPRIQRWNVAIEQQLNSQTSITAAYVGARGDQLFGQAQVNGGSGVPQDRRPDPRFSTQLMFDNLARSHYDSLQVATRRRFAKGLDFTLAYTWAKSVDNLTREVFGAVPGIINLGASSATGFQGGTNWIPRPIDADFGVSDFDVTHNLTFTHLWDVPFGKNRLWGGWSLAGLAVLRSGEPLNVVQGVDYNDDGDISSERPQLTSGTLNDVYARGSFGRTQYLLPQADALQRLNIPIDVTNPFVPIRRNAFRAPHIAYYDFSVLKRFVFRESFQMNFEANFFNVFNNAIFAAPTSNLSSALFGRITSTLAGTNPRQIQFGLKLAF